MTTPQDRKRLITHPFVIMLIPVVVMAWLGGVIGIVGMAAYASYSMYQQVRRVRASRQIAGSLSAMALRADYTAGDLGDVTADLQPVRDMVEDLRAAFSKRDLALREAIQRERLKTLDLEMFADRLEDSGQKLREANDELEAFAYSASHDMAAPLRVIEGLSQILLEDYGDGLDDDGRLHLVTINESSERLLSLLKDLLVLSRVRAPSREDVKRVEVGALVTTIARDRKSEFADNARIIIGGDLPVVEAPSERLRQILENLITNGFKYNDSEQPVVEITGWTEGSISVVRVEDNGIGIPEHAQESCFGLFTRLHVQRSTPGTGAGLAIARRAVRSLGGEMWIEGSSSVGTSFVVAIPTDFTTDHAGLQWGQFAGRQF